MTRAESKFKKNWDEFQKGRKWMYAPVPIIEDPKLSAPAKLLFMIINSYCKTKSICYASNGTLCKKVSLKETMLKAYIKELKESQLITVQLRPSHKWKRQISINFEGLMNRYPLPVPETVDAAERPIKPFFRPFPLEDHPNYETLKDIFKCKKAGDKYLYYRAQA